MTMPSSIPQVSLLPEPRAGYGGSAHHVAEAQLDCPASPVEGYHDRQDRIGRVIYQAMIATVTRP